MAYPALRTTKQDDNVGFSFIRSQLFTWDQAEALEREIFLLRSAQNVFLRHESLSRIKRKKETLNVLLIEKTRIRNIRPRPRPFKGRFIFHTQEGSVLHLLPNLKRIALFVQKLLGGPKISILGHVIQATPI